MPCEAAITPKAPNNASTIYCDVSTLPANTAAGYSGLIMESFGMMISNGFKQPSFNGMLSSTKHLNTYNTAALTTAVGALKLPEC